MNSKVLQSVWDKAQKAEQSRIVSVPNEPADVYLLRNASGELVRHKAEHLRNHQVGSLASIVDVVVENGFIDDSPSEIWVDRTGVVGVFGCEYGRNRATFTYGFSPQMLFLMAAEKTRNSIPHIELMRKLRTLFKNCLPDKSLFEIIRSVRFEAGQVADSAYSNVKKSVGKSITENVTGQSAIPEFVSFTVPLFDKASLDVKRTIECTLEAEATNGGFYLTPVAGEIENALWGGEMEVKDRIAGMLHGWSPPSGEDDAGASKAVAGVVVYHGKP